MVNRTGNIIHKKFYCITIVFAVFMLLIACSSQSGTAPVISTIQPSIPSPSAAPTSQPSVVVATASSPLEIVRTITGDSSLLSMPADLAFDTTGNLYVLDSGNNRVQEFDPAGKFVTMWGSEGSGAGQFNLIAREDITYGTGGIALDKDNNVFVADALNRRIQKFDSTGKFLLQWGSQGLKDGQFIRPINLKLDSQGNIYVVDDHRDDIQKFDLQGKFIKKFGEEGNGNGQLRNTGGMTIGPDGNLYVADYGNHRVEVFSLDGEYLRKWTTAYPKVEDIAFDREGNSFTTHDNGALVKYDPSGKQIYAANDIDLKAPGGIAIDQNGLIYVADDNDVVVLKEK